MQQWDSHTGAESGRDSAPQREEAVWQSDSNFFEKLIPKELKINGWDLSNISLISFLRTPHHPPPPPSSPSKGGGGFIYFPSMRRGAFLQESVKCSTLTAMTRIVAGLARLRFDGDLSGSHHENRGKNSQQIDRLEREHETYRRRVADIWAAITPRCVKTVISSLLRARVRRV